MNPPKILSHGSFLLQTPDEMGHLSSINGCGVRSCDSLWEKRANVSRDFCLSVRAEEVSLFKMIGASLLMKGGKLMTYDILLHFICTVKGDKFKT